MDILGNYLIPFLIVLTVLVFVHEFGHYWVARRVGVRVETFSIGFGPEIVGITDRAGTRWKFSAVPLGGYVKMFGDANASSQPDAEREFTADERKVAFPFKRLHQRAAVVAAGPIANFVFAVVALGAVFALHGQPYTPAVVGEVQEGSAAAQAGVQAGDRFVAIDGTEIERFEDVQRIVRLNPDDQLRIVVQREGERVPLQVTPETRTVEDRFGNTHTIGLLGVTGSEVAYKRYDPASAVWEAGQQTVRITGATLQAVGQIIVGERSADQLGGPVKIAQMSGEVADTGLTNLVWFMAVLSINLGLVNLFPIPMLDGGHLLFYAIEAVRGRPLGERAQEYGFRIGLALVLTLLVFVTWNDLVQLTSFG
ncbi:regulator of sigma E protease [Limimonas halophila]|uniref:Zinc metalloprotease n=1 Tax=Limimonas halophila TaxID=1082479 RepID=A0A1G7N9N9_9PROT|nr:RIP metalloprotease RseP [Limimonas halophila]SDF70651.1 regulator of sigma E protease [Limimonas halophila]